MEWSHILTVRKEWTSVQYYSVIYDITAHLLLFAVTEKMIIQIIQHPEKNKMNQFYSFIESACIHISATEKYGTCSEPEIKPMLNF